MEDRLVLTIQRIADRLTDADVTVATLAQMLGNVEKTYTGSGYYLTPNEPGFKSAWVGISAVGKGQEDVTEVEVVLAAHALLRLEELDGKFGEHKRVPPDPSGSLYVVRYFFDQTAKPYTASIYATLNAAPDVGGAQAEQITIRRDKR